MPQIPAPNPRRIVRRPLDTLPEGETLEHDPQGQILTQAETSAVISAGDDGVPVIANRDQRRLSEYVGDLRPAEPERDIDALTAIEIGAARLLQTIKAHSFDLEALLSNPDDLQSRSWPLKRIFFDWPRPEDEIDPPSAAVMADGRRVYDQENLAINLLEETWNVYGPGTVLRKLASVTAPVMIVAWHANKEERRGFQAAVERTFLAEPGRDEPGRRIVVREHYDRQAMFVLEEADYQDSGERAQAGEWISTLHLSASIDRVVLVVAPEAMEVATPSVTL